MVGFSQEQLAQRLNVDRSTVIRWERGQTYPQPQQRPPLVRALKITGEELVVLLDERSALEDSAYHVGSADVSSTVEAYGGGLPAPLLLDRLDKLDPGALPRQREAAYDELVHSLITWAHSVKRRELLQLISWAASAAVASPVFDDLESSRLERMGRVLEAPSRVDDDVIDHIEQVLHRCIRQDDALGPQAAMDTVLAQRSLARAMLAECRQPFRRRLLAVYSNLSAYAGWLAFDLNDFDGASYYFETARTGAHESQDSEMGALILCNMSHLATWRGMARVGIDHAVAAQVWATKTGNRALQAYPADRAARAFAADGDRRACVCETDRAQALLDAAAPCEPDDLMAFYNAGLLSNTRSVCLRVLGEPKRAAEQTLASLLLIEPSFTRNRAFTVLHLATAYVQAREIDEAATMVGQAAQYAVQNRSARLAKALQWARADLHSWARTRAAAALDDRLTGYGFPAWRSGST
jgi:transcriptional regulator with XRE-family HTH domain